jgi:hypothetical protein
VASVLGSGEVPPYEECRADTRRFEGFQSFNLHHLLDTRKGRAVVVQVRPFE